MTTPQQHVTPEDRKKIREALAEIEHVRKAVKPAAEINHKLDRIAKLITEVQA